MVGLIQLRKDREEFYTQENPKLREGEVCVVYKDVPQGIKDGWLAANTGYTTGSTVYRNFLKNYPFEEVLGFKIGNNVDNWLDLPLMSSNSIVNANFNDGVLSLINNKNEYINITISSDTLEGVSLSGKTLIFNMSESIDKTVDLSTVGISINDTTPTTGSTYSGTKITAIENAIPATVRNTTLSGLTTSTVSAITSGDTVLTAFGKLQAQVTNNSSLIPKEYLPFKFAMNLDTVSDDFFMSGKITNLEEKIGAFLASTNPVTFQVKLDTTSSVYTSTYNSQPINTLAQLQGWINQNVSTTDNWWIRGIGNFTGTTDNPISYKLYYKQV